MASNQIRTAAGASRQNAAMSTRTDAISIFEQHGVTVASVSAILNQPSRLIRPSDRSVYLRDPDNKAGLLKMIFTFPKARGYRRIDPDHRGLRDKLNQIRLNCKVWINLHDDPDPTHFIVLAEEENRLQEAFAALLRLVKLPDPDAEDMEQGMVTYLIYPPHDKDAFLVTAPTNPQGRPRFTAAPVEGKSLSRADRAHQASEFLEEFKTIATILQRAPDKMLMRLNLGTISLRRRPKMTEFNLENFEKLMRGIRQRMNTEFESSIGDGNYGKALLDMIRQRPEVFEGTEATDLALEHVKPHYILIVVANELRLETEIVSEVKGYSYTPSKVYRSGQRSKLACINTFCPEKKLDWSLSVITESDTRIVPAALTKFIQDIRLDKLKAQVGVMGFPKPSFDTEAVSQAQVSQVIGRTVWQFAICDTPYVMEVAIHNQWDPRNMTVGPVVSCGLCILGRRWDQELSWTNTVIRERDWGTDFDQIYLGYEDQTGIESFLEVVDKVQELVGTIPAGRN